MLYSSKIVGKYFNISHKEYLIVCFSGFIDMLLCRLSFRIQSVPYSMFGLDDKSHTREN